MKILITIVLLGLVGVIVWQGVSIQTLEQASHPKQIETRSPKHVPRASGELLADLLPDWKNLSPALREMLSRQNYSSTEQQELFQEILGLSDPAERAVAITRWAENHATTEELQNGLEALLQAPDSDREVLLSSFGPALFSQWGLLAPENGYLAWISLGTEEQSLTTNSNPHPLAIKNTSYRVEPDLFGNSVPIPPPAPLLDAWAANDPDGFFAAISEGSSLFHSAAVKERGVDVSERDIVETLLAHEEVQKVAERIEKIPEGAEPIMRKTHMTRLLSNQLRSDFESVQQALEKVESFPKSPTRDLLEMDLKTSWIVEQGEELLNTGQADSYQEVLKDFLNDYESSSELVQGEIKEILERGIEGLLLTGRNPKRKQVIIDLGLTSR